MSKSKKIRKPGPRLERKTKGGGERPYRHFLRKRGTHVFIKTLFHRHKGTPKEQERPHSFPRRGRPEEGGGRCDEQAGLNIGQEKAISRTFCPSGGKKSGGRKSGGLALNGRPQRGEGVIHGHGTEGKRNATYELRTRGDVKKTLQKEEVQRSRKKIQGRKRNGGMGQGKWGATLTRGGPRGRFGGGTS